MRLTTAAAAVGFLSFAAPAHADAIDGHWCYKDGRRMHIDGPSIMLPSGRRIKGDYDRHGFAYVVPPGDRGAGGKVEMSLQSDYILHVKPAGGSQEVWQRCKKGVS
jgi:hypothetical protein